MSPAPLLWLVVRWMFFGTFLLKCVLVRWCLDAVLTSRIFQLTVILGADIDSFGAESVSYGMLVASILVSLGTIERSGGTSEHKKGVPGVQD